MSPKQRSNSFDRNVRKMVHACLPKSLADRYCCTLRHWRKAKGSEWTAKRLKALWNCALLLRSGQSEAIPKVCLEERIACSDRLPKGIEGVLVQNFAHTQRPSKIRLAATPLRSYTAIQLTKASRAQVSKAKKSICSEGCSTYWTPMTTGEYRRLYTGQGMSDRIVKAIDEGGMLVLNPFRAKVRPHQPLRLDNLNRLSGTSRYPTAQHVNAALFKSNPYMSMLSSMLTRGKVPKALVNYFGDFELRRYAEQVQEDCGDASFGKINIIQEGGAKGRVVTSPNAWVQFYCKPYHTYLSQCVALVEKRELNGIPIPAQYGASCMFDQVRGVYLALNQLNNGSFCAGVDLSSATDRFPLSMQMCMCEELGIPEFAQALDELRGPYLGLDNMYWNYGAGQPMGLFGSFPLFHLTHFSLLSGLCYLLGLQANGHNFAVLGDDVLIFDARLHRSYLDALERLQVPVSWNKCYQGNLVEFAGFVITKSQGTWTAFRPYKYGKSGEFASVLNVLHAIGVNARNWSKYWARAFEIYQKTSGLRQLDLSPMYAEDADIRKDNSLPSGHWFGSQLNRLSYEPYTTNGGQVKALPDGIAEAWHADRYTLCQTQISDTNPYYYGEAQPDDRLLEPTTFSPDEYVRSDLARKRMWKTFWSDSLVSSFMQG